MIEFSPITLDVKTEYERLLLDGKERGCGHSFANLFLWGEQSIAFLYGYAVLFSRFGDRCMYPFPVGSGDIKPVLDAVLADAEARGIPCRFIGMRPEDVQTLETLYPGRFDCSGDRDYSDYVYDIEDLAELRGRKYHRKRNHDHRFWEAFPDCAAVPLSEENLPQVKQLAAQWYADKLRDDPDGDFDMERAALEKALDHYEEMGLEGLVLLNGTDVLALTLGSRLSPDTFDVHFEKAGRDVEGAYTAINRAFAQHIRDKYPEIRFLNREEDMGLEGLRSAKESYFPHHMLEKWRACAEPED